MIEKFVLYAPNVHCGGGFVLLRTVLESVPKSMSMTMFLDERAREQLNLPKEAKVHWVMANASSRLSAEFALRRIAGAKDTVLCFHGLPPLLPTAAQILVFQQNKNYLGLNSLNQFALKTRVRLIFERFVSRVFRHRVTEYIVQTPSMQHALSQWYGARTLSEAPVVRVLPFVNALLNPSDRNSVMLEWDFVYVADGEAHKNHRTLLSAWRLLAQEGLYPSLALTLSSRDAALKFNLKAIAIESGLRIKDLGQMSHENILDLYTKSNALIFPSTSESFGLPLIEATHLGLPILASELDYVRDVCSPVQTFDPASPVSIARAVKRFLAVPEPVLQLRSPQEFWRELLDTTSD